MRRCRHGLATASRLLPSRTVSCQQYAFSLLRGYSSSGPVNGHDVAVLGGGITGLVTAYYLTRELPKAKVTIYEASDRLGGWLSSKRVPVKDGTVLFEAGPRTLRPSSNGVLSARLIQELDLANDAIYTQKTSPAARNRFVYYPNHLVLMPHPTFGIMQNFTTLINEPVFQGTIWAGLTEVFRAIRDPSVQDESVGEFFSRRFSKTQVDRLLSAIIHGIYAGDVWRLSAKSLFPGPWRDEAEVGSVFAGLVKSKSEGLEVTVREAEYLREMKDYKWNEELRWTLKDTTVFTFRDGLGMLSDRLASHLLGSGQVAFKTSTPVKSLTMSDDKTQVLVHAGKTEQPTGHSHVVSALSPGHLNSLSPNKDIRLIPEIPTVTVMTVNVYYRTPGLHQPGFGYLIPLATPFEQNPERALGVVFDDAYAPGPEAYLITQMMDPAALKEYYSDNKRMALNHFMWHNLPNKPNVQDQTEPPHGTKMTVMLGGHYWDGWPAYPDEKEGLALAKAVLERHLGIKEEPEAWQVNLQRDCIPQYTVGHENRLKTAHNNIWREYRGRLRVTGNWMSGVGVNDCIRSAWDVVRGLRDGKDGTGLDHIGANDYIRLKPVKRGQKEEEEEE